MRLWRSNLPMAAACVAWLLVGAWGGLERSGPDQDGLVIPPAADSWYEVALAGLDVPIDATPHGAASQLSGGWRHLENPHRIVMRFAIPEREANRRIEKAELEMEIVDAGVHPYSPPLVTSGTMAISLREVREPWNELQLSSADPPDVGPVLRTEDVPWGPCEAGSCGTVRIDVTDFVEAWLADPQKQQAGLAFDARGSVGRPIFATTFQVASRETDAGPRLHLTPLDGDTPVRPTRTGAPTTATGSSSPTRTTGTPPRTPIGAEPAAPLYLPRCGR